MLTMNQEAVDMLEIVVAACREARLLNEYGVLPFGADIPETAYALVVMCRRCGDIRGVDSYSVGTIIRQYMTGKFVRQEVAS